MSAWKEQHDKLRKMLTIAVTGSFLVAVGLMIVSKPWEKSEPVSDDYVSARLEQQSVMLKYLASGAQQIESHSGGEGFQLVIHVIDGSTLEGQYVQSDMDNPVGVCVAEGLRITFPQGYLRVAVPKKCFSIADRDEIVMGAMGVLSIGLPLVEAHSKAINQ